MSGNGVDADVGLLPRLGEVYLNDLGEHRPPELWEHLRRELGERLRSCLQAGVSIGDARLLPCEPPDEMKIALLIYSPYPPDEHRDCPSLRLRVCSRQRIWRICGESRFLGVSEPTHEVYARIDLIDVDGDGAQEIAVSGDSGNTGVGLALFRWDGGALSQIAAPGPRSEFVGTVGLGPQDLDGDGVMEVLDPGWMCAPDYPNRTERVWRLTQGSYVRWQLRKFRGDNLESISTWNAAGD